MTKNSKQGEKTVRRETMAAAIIIGLVFVALFGPVILGGKFFVLYDASSYSYPLRTVAWKAVLEGRLPLWTPLIMSGYPLFSMAQLSLFYPLTWGYLFLPGHWAEEIYVLAPFLLAPFFMYLYAREMKRSWTAALLAGLAFGYGGMFVIGYVHNGMLANSTMWLPLMLIGIERARTRRAVPALLWIAAPYLMSVLTGIGQGFLFVGLIAAAYALFLSLAVRREAEDEEREPGQPALLSFSRWRPLLLAIAAILLSAGVAAVQILETARAARRSIRSSLEYGVFSGNSFNLLMSWKSLVAPLSPAVFPFDTSAYVAPLVLLLAMCAIALALRGRRRDVRVFFWAGTAAVAWLLMLGEFLPFYWLLHRIPLLNLFRAPARHAFEWTFALSILAAYGWDGVRMMLPARQLDEGNVQGRWKYALTALVALLLVVAVVWWRQAGSFGTEFFETPFLLWKAVFTILLLSALWLVWKLAGRSHGSARLLVGLIVLACLIEPCIVITKWWWPLTKPSSRFTDASAVTRLLQNFPPEQNRVYTRVGPFEMEYEPVPPIDPPDVTALYKLQNVAGYEPLIQERYSRALGNVGFDTVGTRWGFAPERDLLSARSHVLDLLNNRFVALYKRDFLPGQFLEKEGIRFTVGDEGVAVKPRTTRTLMSVGATGDTLALVTTLANSSAMADGETVARLRIFKTDGGIVERELRAGVDTSEWAFDRPDVRSRIRHKLAPVFDSAPGDAANSFPSHRYWSRIALGAPVDVDRVEIENVTPNVELGVWKATVYDAAHSSSTRLERFIDKDEELDAARWQTVYHEQGVRVLRNERALPRVWLVGEAEAVDGEEALLRIQGRSERAFDPQRTALLEVPPQELPQLMPAADLTNANAKLVGYEDNRLVIETGADAPAVLVVSEMNYPGWVASVDGQPAPIHSADFILRGVALPAGRHTVEMRYVAPPARNGLLISVCTLLLIGGLLVYERRRRPLSVPVSD